MASSYSSAKLAPPVAGTTVVAFELGPDKKQYWYTIQVLPFPMTIPGSDAPPVPRRSYSIYRRIEDIVDFAGRLEQEFPWLKTYTDGSQTQSDPAFIADGSQRKQELDTYLRRLFTLGSIISQCRLVSEFFGIWKTDLKFHLSQADQDPLALHSVVPRRPLSVLSPVASRVAFELRHDYASSIQDNDRRHSTASSPLWSPESPSLLSSVSSSDHEDSDGGSDFSGGSAESDSVILDKFPPPPHFTIKKATSMQNLRPSLRGFEPCSSSPLSPSYESSTSQQAPSVVSTHTPHHQHTPARSFGEGTIQSELGQLGSFPPRATSLQGTQLRRTSLQHHEIRPRWAIQDHARSHSSAGGYNSNLASALRMNSKNSAYVSTSPLSTSPPLTSSSTQSLAESIEDIAVLLDVASGTPAEAQQQDHHVQETSSLCSLQGKAPMTSTAPLSPKTRAHRKILKAAYSMPSLLTGSMRINTNNMPSSSPLTSPVSQGPPSPTYPVEGHKQRASHTNQKQPASILKHGHSSSKNSSNNNKGFAFNHNVSVHYQPQHPQVQSPALGAGFLAQHPQGFAATFKLVVSTDMIVALQVLEEEEGFVLSVPDLRLRVLNKFRRMNTGIPEDFELMWTGWDGTRVLLKNDEELQRALKASSNNKVTLRCIFF
ncbi:hypothetical protein BGZ95_006602 [Linnemannia exigua]|uniref:PX domain-containing protein n=1 Tax=Linnemannia exigua TaxID=604196 RepID=A0AAD4DG95_9FUNG|nr:hypothetical protein BGZ95_006602 [Linnemannia exigua]